MEVFDTLLWLSSFKHLVQLNTKTFETHFLSKRMLHILLTKQYLPWPWSFWQLQRSPMQSQSQTDLRIWLFLTVSTGRQERFGVGRVAFWGSYFWDLRLPCQWSPLLCLHWYCRTYYWLSSLFWMRPARVSQSQFRVHVNLLSMFQSVSWPNQSTCRQL